MTDDPLALIDRLLRGAPPLPGEEAERAEYEALIALIRDAGRTGGRATDGARGR